ncbi:MAG: metallophosphoesterase, partial [Parvularculaceae bacterium]
MRWAENIQKRLAVLVAAAAAALSLSACATASESAPAPVIAVGDLHGDYDAYISILRAAGLVSARGKWSGGKATLVQLGDVPDRGPDTKKIIEHLIKLEKEAKKKGGRVVPLIGNHEAMNVIGDLRYVTPEEYAAFATAKSKKLRDAHFKANFAALAEFYRKKDPTLDDEGVRAAFEKEAPLGYIEHRLVWGPNGAIGSWIASHDAAVRIGDTLFVHGGISAGYAASTIAAINEAVRRALKAGGGFILEDELGPLWHRGNVEESAAHGL